jgi:hypothetical protein
LVNFKVTLEFWLWSMFELVSEINKRKGFEEQFLSLVRGSKGDKSANAGSCDGLLQHQRQIRAHSEKYFYYIAWKPSILAESSVGI